ncbi:MAG: DUF4288 domain-containing protein [Chitinophagaceae bacterium]|nr:MAG: DUF4288 domain-containing protein [Chitinophagaceae bacterium]
MPERICRQTSIGNNVWLDLQATKRCAKAETKESAFTKAQEFGFAEQDNFYNRKEQLVQWQFINVSELYLLSELIDGAELYSRIEERDNAESYIYTVNQKAENIFFTQTHQLLKLA